MDDIKFEHGTDIFTLEHPDNYTYLYFPLAGEQGIKSSVTPNLGGDSKAHQNAFILEPVSSENLHNNKSTRNFWCGVGSAGAWSATGVSAEAEFQKYTDFQDKCSIQAGFMWQKITRSSKKYQLKAKIISFVPLINNVEIMRVTIENKSRQRQRIVPTAAVPVYGRSADNIRDHRHVAMLFFTLFSNNGPVNMILMQAGIIHEPFHFMSSTAGARSLIAFMNFLMWFGNTTILLMAGMMGIDLSLFEAAEVDGATSFQIFSKITLPLIKPILAYVMVTSLIGGLQMFDLPQILTNGQGGPNRTTMTLIMYLNKHLFNENYGMAGALSAVLFIITGALSIWVFKSITGRDEK